MAWEPPFEPSLKLRSADWNIVTSAVEPERGLLTLLSLAPAARRGDDRCVMRAVIAVVVAISLVGCGLTMTRGPSPNRPADQRPDCTETMDAPKKDAIPAALGFFTFLIGLLFYKVSDHETVGAGLMVGGGVVTVGSYASGGVGYYRVKACQRAIRDFERRASAPIDAGGEAAGTRVVGVEVRDLAAREPALDQGRELRAGHDLGLDEITALVVRAH